jgi:hypothetical protein
MPNDPTKEYTEELTGAFKEVVQDLESTREQLHGAVDELAELAKQSLISEE